MIAAIFILQTSKIRGEREFTMNTNTVNSKKVISGINDLATECPKAAAMWSDKNAFTPSEVSAKNSKKALFVCPDCKQEFEAPVHNVVHSVNRGYTGCPSCANRKVIPGINDLKTQCPKVANMWSSKNAYAPGKVSASSNKKMLFVCPDCGQEFTAPIYSVVKSVSYGNTGCPVCAGRKVVPGINDLVTKRPKVAAMWSDKNDYTPSEIPAWSSRRAIFVCPDCKQEFVTSVRNMTRAIASGINCCPECGKHIFSAARKDEHGFPKPVGTTMTMKDGSKATCTAYHGVNNITVEFEDGFVLYHTRWNQFVRGALHHSQKTTKE